MVGRRIRKRVGSGGQTTADSRLREFLAGQDSAWLADELLNAAASDPLLLARLERAAGRDPGRSYDDTKLRGRLHQAAEVADYVSYREAAAYFRDVDEALDQVEELIEQGSAAAVVGLAEYALELLEDSAELVDDSDGGLRAAIDRAEEIHLAACVAARPDPVKLAERLAQLALASDWEIFLTALPTYANVLGPAGMARYRELVESAWRGLPAKKRDEYGSGFTITRLMERLAECEGGTDALVEVLARDVDSSYDIWRIAERLCADGRDEDALEWLRRGLKDFEPDSRLRALAAECHLRAGRRRDAIELLWANFADRPSVEAYQTLQAAAGDAWATWRKRALKLLRGQPRAKEISGPSYLEPAGHSTLVEVLLWEGDVDAAWSAARIGGCRSRLRLRLARERGRTHPADAIPIIQSAAEAAMETKKRATYGDAAALLKEAKSLARRCGQTKEFGAYLIELRATHKRKRALLAELDRAGLR
ncbi:DUF6880 family protein [Actinopolymorpha alba]|uniref:DUF6880 family protein n=1 Tax=Actinopolymorpha alba TaxID=533267 RepID=UPI0003659D1D|nr:DUF6880 family protein [Actinopolymorpha alba]